jgi:hypothetical protein
MFCVFGKSYQHEYQKKHSNKSVSYEKYDEYIESCFKKTLVAIKYLLNTLTGIDVMNSLNLPANHQMTFVVYIWQS